MKKSILITLIAIIFMHCFAGCGSKTTIIDAKDFVNVDFKGFSGKGKVSFTLNENRIDTAVDEYSKGPNKNLTVDFEKALNSMYYKVVSDKIDNLSNGDEILIRVKYENRHVDNAKIQIKNEEFTYTVSGLDEPIMLDPFAGIELIYNGISPDASVQIHKDLEMPFIREIKYNVVPSSYLKIGDKIVVTAKLDVSKAESVGFIVPDILSKEYTVENIDEYVKDFNDLDQVTKDDMKSEATERIKTACTDGYGSIIDNLDLWFIDSENIKFEEPELVNIYFNFISKESFVYSNKIFYVFKITATVSGSTEPRIGYVATRFQNAIKKADGSTEVELGGPDRYPAPLFSSGKEFDIVYSEVVTSQRDFYEIQEITP